jgi:hypothetical protein
MLPSRFATSERPPVRDVHGSVVWRVRVGPGEVTCLQCGETYSPNVWGGCPRCNSAHEHGSQMHQTPTVPTEIYLRANEYEYVK